MAEYWFDGTDGSNSNDGLSAGAPKRSIESGLTVSGTCIFNIKRGTTVTVGAATFPTGDFTLRPYGDGSERATVYAPLQITNATSGGTYTVAPGMRLLGAGTGTVPGINCEQGAIYAEDIWLEGFYNGVTGGRDGGYVRNSRIFDCRNNCISIGNSSYAAPSGFQVYNNYIDGSAATNDAVTFHDGTGTGVNGLVANNYIIGGAENCVDITSQFSGIVIRNNECVNAGQTGIIVAGSNCQIFGNKITECGYEGMAHHTGAANNTFQGNIVYNCSTSGTNANGFVGRGTGAFRLYKNTIVAGPRSANTNRMISLLTASVTGYAANNIIAIIGATVNRYVEILDADASLFLFQNNLYYGASGTTNPFSINNGSSRTFAQWQALSALGGGTQDVGGAVSDPLLDADLAPKTGSPALGTGTRIADVVLRDFYGKEITDVPDIGAIQVYAARSVSAARATSAARAAVTRNPVTDRAPYG